MARAYLHARKHGSPPAWARKLENDQWLFESSYIQADAADNLKFVGVSEAAERVPTSRRTIQTWVDEGVLAVEDAAQREKGQPRRILRDPFLQALPDLRRRLDGQLHPLRRALEKLGLVGPDEPAGEWPEPEEVETRLIEMEDRRREAERKRRDAETAVSRARAEERASADAEQKLRETFDKQLRDLRRRLREAQGEHRAALKEWDAVVKEHRQVVDEEQRLRGVLARIQKEARQREAATVEAQLLAAVETRRQETAMEALARPIAERLLDQVFDGGMARTDAMAMFNQLAKQKGVSDDVRIRVRKQIFGK